MRTFHALTAALAFVSACSHAPAPSPAASAEPAPPAALPKLARNQAATVALVFVSKVRGKDGKATEARIPGSGVVMTRRHVLTAPADLAISADQIEIRGVNGKGESFSANLASVRAEPNLNVALLETKAPLPVEPVSWNLAMPKEGEVVYSVDFFGGLFIQAAHVGRVSFSVESDERISFFLFDAPTSFSSRGCGVYDARGELAGILVSAPSPGRPDAVFGQALAASEIFGWLKGQKGLAPSR